MNKSFTDDIEEIYSKEKIENKLNKINQKYDETTINNLAIKLLDQRQISNTNFYEINKKILKKNTNAFDDEYIDYRGIELKNFNILNFNDLILKINQSYIINQRAPVKNKVLYHGFQDDENLLSSLLEWEYYLNITNIMSTIFFEISKILYLLNDLLKENEKIEKHLLTLMKEILNHKQNGEFDLNEFQNILKNSYLFPLIQVVLQSSNDFKQNSSKLKNFSEIKIELSIKKFEEYFNACVEKIIIYNTNDMLLCIFILNFDINEQFISFFVFLLDKDDYVQILLNFINKDIENEIEDHIFNTESKKKVKDKRILNITNDIEKENKKIEILRTELDYIDTKKTNNVPKWKRAITDSKIQYLNYGFMTTGY
jgi:hypothetical protein